MDSRTKEFVLSELIGEAVEVKQSVRRDMQGLQGRILDETKHTFLVQARNGRKTVPKKGSVFLFPETGISVNGSDLLYRPEDRTKLLGRKRRT